MVEHLGLRFCLEGFELQFDAVWWEWWEKYDGKGRVSSVLVYTNSQNGPLVFIGPLELKLLMKHDCNICILTLLEAAIHNGVSPNLFPLSTFAPLAIKYITSFTWLFLEAANKYEHPSLFTWLTSKVMLRSWALNGPSSPVCAAISNPNPFRMFSFAVAGFGFVLGIACFEERWLDGRMWGWCNCL